MKIFFANSNALLAPSILIEGFLLRLSLSNEAIVGFIFLWCPSITNASSGIFPISCPCSCFDNAIFPAMA